MIIKSDRKKMIEGEIVKKKYIIKIISDDINNNLKNKDQIRQIQKIK